MISVLWLAGLVLCLPLTLLLLFAVQQIAGVTQYEVLLLPLGPLTAGMHRVVRPMAEERATNWQDMWASFRADWRWSTLLTLALVGGAILIQVNMAYYLSSSALLLRMLGLMFTTLLIIWTGAALYAFPLALRQHDMRIRTILRNAALMAMGNAPGVLVGLLLLGLLLVLLLIPPLFLLIPGVIALWSQENVRLLLIAAGYLAKDPIADRE